MTNRDELTQTLKTLPAFSAAVLNEVLNGLYAEPGFSDVDAADIAKALNTSRQAVGGALSHLIELGLVFVETHDGNNILASYIFSDLHDYEGTREFAMEILNPSTTPVEVEVKQVEVKQVAPRTTRITARKIAALITSLGLTGELVWNRTYFYLVGPSFSVDAESTSIMVSQLNHLTMAQWKDEILRIASV